MTTGASPALKALNYAENTLGVHVVYDDAIKARNLLDKVLTDLGEARDRKRELEARILDVEMEVIAEERGKHPDMSQAQMDKHVKLAMHDNDQAREGREQLLAVVNDIDGLEMDKTMCETDIRIAVARMQELGGFLQYLAVIKQSGNTNVPTNETSTP